MSSVEPSARAAAKRVLQTPPLPEGVQTLLTYLMAIEGEPPRTVRQMAAEFDKTISCVSGWIRRAKRAGLLTVTRVEKRNHYRINYEQLQRLAEGSD